MALGRDLGDFFGFEVTRIVALQEEAKGSRVHVRATLGAKTFAVFHIDVVVGTASSGEPDVVAPLTPLHVDGPGPTVISRFLATRPRGGTSSPRSSAPTSGPRR